MNRRSFFGAIAAVFGIGAAAKSQQLVIAELVSIKGPSMAGIAAQRVEFERYHLNVWKSASTATTARLSGFVVFGPMSPDQARRIEDRNPYAGERLSILV